MSIFKTYDDETDWFMIFWFGILLVVLIVGLPITMYDEMYVKPIASNNANDYCKNLGFDQYKSYSRVGILSKNPVAIKCEYAEKYTDLGVRSNIQ